MNTLLALRTDFSLGESTISSSDIVNIAKRLEQKHVCFADTMQVSGMIDISKTCEKEGIEVHIGVRLRVVDDVETRGDEGKSHNKQAWYPKVYARNEGGLKEIYKLLSLATEEDHFFYVARVTLDDIFKTLTDKNVVFSTGDARGLFSRSDHPKLLSALVARYSVFTELVAVPTPYYERCNLNALLYGANLDKIVTIPTLYDDGKYESLKLNMAIQNRSDFRKSFTYALPDKEFRPHFPKEFADAIKETILGMRVIDPSIDATAFKEALSAGIPSFLHHTAYRWSKQPVALPKLAVDAPGAVMDACKKGIRERLIDNVFGYHPSLEEISKTYIPRLKYEMEVLTKLGFCDYFLVVADLVNWARNSNITVGCGRGSIGGSLIAFLMGITDVDPIRFDLLFERFINPSRNDLPDADLDFMSTRREEIISYLESKYGKDHVAGINNYGVLGSASALKDIARVYGVDMSNFPASKFIPKIHGQSVSLQEAYEQVAEMQTFADDHPKVWKGALSIQNVMRQYGRHAAGTIVSGVPIVDRGVVERDGTSRKVNWDGSTCEIQGLVKFDVLGLSTLDTISRAVSYVKERTGKRIDINTIPLDDAKTLKAFSEGDTIGIFQMEGGVARRMLKDMAGASGVEFSDLVAVNALNRPGPLDAELDKSYIRRKNGDESITYPHPLTSAALKDTYGVITYQEQIMRIAVDLCGFTGSEADSLRKAIGKKDAVLMASYRDKFVKGAFTVAGMEEREAELLFTTIEGFAAYSFNKSHSVAYSLISYQCMWLKVHYPIEFYAASLSTVKEEKLQVIVNDASIRGIKLLPPDINISTNEFIIGNDTTLFMPFNRIKGVSDKGGDAIVEARNLSVILETKSVGRGKDKQTLTSEKRVTTGKFASKDDFLERVNKRIVNSRVVENLDTVGALSRIESGQPQALDISRRKNQFILLPGLMTGTLIADRDIPSDKFTVSRLKEIMDDIEAVDPYVRHVAPAIGRKSKFMVVLDGATQDEESEKLFTAGRSFQYTSGALKVAELSKGDAYWTGLIKRKKAGRSLSPMEIKTYQPFLERELELLKPPVILTLGSAAARFFIPDLKGDIMDHVGRTFYSEKHDAMIVIGFNPMMCHFAPEKFDTLAELFELVRSMVSPSF